MKRFQCNNHGIVIHIPTIEQEFLLGKYHQDVEKCSEHNNQFPNCKFFEIREEL